MRVGLVAVDRILTSHNAEESLAKDDEMEEPKEGLAEFIASWGPAILALVFIRLFIFEPFRIPSGSMVPTLLVGDQVMIEKFSYGIWLPFKSLGVPFTGIGLDDFGLDIDNVELLDLGDPQRGDVIVFHYPENEDINFIKRVVGLPGETIEVRNNQVFINGERQGQDKAGTYSWTSMPPGASGCVEHTDRLWMETLERPGEEPLVHEVLTGLRGMGGLANMTPKVIPADSVFVMGDNRDNSADSRAWGFVQHGQIKGKAHFIWLSMDGCDGALGTPRKERFFKSLYEAPVLPEGSASASN